MDRNLALEIVRVTEAAALRSGRAMGRGDRRHADQLAVDAMRKAFDQINIRGTVVIGAGERQDAPMLYMGEKVGRGGPDDPEVEIAVDPLEGTNLCALGLPNAISVVALAEKGCFLSAPDIYMEKVAVGPRSKGVIDLTKSPTENLRAIADAKGVYVEDLTAMILDRERHAAIIEDVRRAGARIKLIRDGDIAAALATCKEDSGVDVLFGTGGAPEGVIAAAALRCVGGDFQGRLLPRNEEERERCQKMGIADMERIYKIDELAAGDVLFGATGVTSGDFFKGVRYTKGGAVTHSVVMRSESGTIRWVETEHHLDRQRPH
ncbi:MAG: class II fructose-bisphosphatase [Deltaproteobacteria bacterium]|nr:class II fructose-bisphosphatase [Deltaproteobacteria bacterium]